MFSSNLKVKKNFSGSWAIYKTGSGMDLACGWNSLQTFDFNHSVVKLLSTQNRQKCMTQVRVCQALL
jgi:hypothetical protein